MTQSGGAAETVVVLTVLDGDRYAATESLIAWLRQEPELRRTLRTVDRVPGDGEMGSLVDAATVALGAGGAVSVLAMSLKAWFAQPRRSDMTIKIQHPDGRSVHIDAKRVDDVEALLHRVLGTGE